MRKHGVAKRRSSGAKSANLTKQQSMACGGIAAASGQRSSNIGDNRN